MTDRHPMDCWLTPPCAARALCAWLCDRPAWDGAEPFLDPFAGPGTLLPWAMPDVPHFAFEMDARWGPELRAHIPAMNTRLGRDSLQMEWLVRGHCPHIVTNPPFGRIRIAVEMAADHARTNKRWACMLMRTDWWQHPDRSHLRPDHMLLLEWRPVFGLNRHGKFGSDYAGYAWCVWAPSPTGECHTEWLARPEVPKELVAEHRRLARIAHEMGREAQGAP